MPLPGRRKYIILGVMGVVLLSIVAVGEYEAILSLLSSFTAHDPLGQLAASSASRVMVAMAACGIAAILIAVVSLAFIGLEIARRRRTERRMARLASAAEQTGDLITIINKSGRIEYVNRAVERTTGYRREELIGRQRVPWYADDKPLRVMRETVMRGTSYHAVASCKRKNGEPFLLQEHVEPFQDSSGAIKRMISTARDVTAEKALEERVAFLDRHEPLTGIPNRRYLVELLEQQLAGARKRGASVCVLIMDIDRFKYINDIFGYEMGDRVLKKMAELVRSAAGAQDITARIGSDEFAVAHQGDRQTPDAAALARKIKESVSSSMTIDGHDIVVTLTMGIAVFPQHGEDAETLIKNADMALSRAKAAGRSTVQFFSPDFGERMSDLYFLEKRLFGALKNNEYLVRYQPYCNLSTKKIVGTEALISWKSGDLGIVSPTRFIPTLEDTGMIIDVGEWVLRTACEQLQQWCRSSRDLTVSVNLSLIQFRHKYLIDMVSEAVRNFRIDPRLLTLEVTESICIHDIDQTVTILKKLKDTGVSISVDDFGTGYSSLNYIKKLPVDNLKIDMSFVRDVAKDPDAASIVTAITGLARSLSLKTIAEGVESEEQRNILHLLRCDMGQGYYFSRAVPAEEFGKLL